MQQLHHNPYGYYFKTSLFAANVQGSKAEQSIIAALEQIYEQMQHFDLVAILRGGGSQSDLSCFDSYELACHVAQFPMPVITGIGHDKDVSIIDHVAHTRLKTPTAAAEFLIEQLAVQVQYLENLQEQILSHWKAKTEQCKQTLHHQVLRVKLSVSECWSRHREKINYLYPQRLKSAFRQFVQNENNKLLQRQTKIDLLNPQNLLQRGYSITLHNGKPLRNALQVKPGDCLKTLLKDGEVMSRVE
jgi:exodeoxyribonuclease VII large subunit